MARVCLVSREHHPFGGGIGVSVPALAETLASEHEVTLVTDGADESRLPSPPAGVRRVAVHPPSDWHRAGFACEHHAWSASAVEAIERAYGGGSGPDLLEAPDYGGEAHVALQAALTGAAVLAATQIVVRLRGSAELTLLHNDIWPNDEPTRAMFAMERECLSHADRLLVAGGVIDKAYSAYYGSDALAPIEVVRLPLADTGANHDHRPRGGGPLRLLYAGRLDRLKGVLELVEAVLRLPDAAITLTLVGDDSRTGPLGRSMRDVLEAMSAGDERVVLAGRRSRDDVVAMMAASDVVVLPSRIETWANTAHEAMAVGTPVLATPVGGFVEQVVPCETGWLTDGIGCEAITRAISALAADPTQVDILRSRGNCRSHVAALADRSAVLDAYRALIERGATPPRPTTSISIGRVTAVIPTRDDGPFVDRAVRSVLAHAGPLADCIVVDDGSAGETFGHLQRLRSTPSVQVIHQRHGGASAARNTGILFADGELVLLLDADDELLPGFLERAAATLRTYPELSYAVPWHLFADAGVDGTPAERWCPLGSAHELGLLDLNLLGGSCVVVRRRILEDPATRFEPSNVINQDRELLEVLTRRGYRGCVVPVSGVRSTRRADSISHSFFATHRRASLEEMRARMRTRELTWAMK